MHDVARVVNRDIKPDNMLFMTQENGTDRKGDRAQIADFTTAVRVPHEDFKVTGNMGTFCFLAPEVHQNGAFKPKPLDVWALGISIYAVVFGRVPFFANSDQELVAAITSSEPDFSLPVAFSYETDKSNKVSDQLKDLLKALLTKDPDQRPSIKKAIETYVWL